MQFLSLKKGHRRILEMLGKSGERGGYVIGATAYKRFADTVLVDFTGTTIANHQEAMELIGPHGFAQRVRRMIHKLVNRYGLLGRCMPDLGMAVPALPCRPWVTDEAWSTY